ncbi:AI-2E family transporter [Rugosimonospora acidiphila]|uniref:AI-2E family transporter n=1 Tax=Rugosimonospora acidiphila TaxID=556531 RepID=A0ABP9SPC7_9ACTN
MAHAQPTGPGVGPPGAGQPRPGRRSEGPGSLPEQPGQRPERVGEASERGDAAPDGLHFAAVQAAIEEAAELTDDPPVYGAPGRPINRRSPFTIGLLGAAGVAVAYVLGRVIVDASGVLLLIGLSLFLAIGLDPAVRWLTRLRLPRWAAVLVVALVTIGMVVGFLSAAIPPLVSQADQFAHELPGYAAQLRDHSTALGRLDARFHLQDRLDKAVSSINAGDVFGGLLGAGRVVLSATTSTLTVLVLTVYLLADLPRIRRLMYRLIPASRRPRAILLGDEMFTRVGGFVLGNVLTSLIAGAGTFLWLVAFGVPYPVLLAIAVAILDLIPVVGSTVGGVLVSLVALTVSLPVALGTLAFYVVYRLVEDYLIVPRIIGRTVQVPATTTVLAVLIGGAVLGFIGALIAIPVAAAIGILLREVAFPRLDRS